MAARRRRAEAELREKEGRLRSLVESSGDGILAYDTDIRVTLWNPAMESISGIRAEELLGRSLFEEFPFLHEVPEGEAFGEAIRDPVERPPIFFSAPAIPAGWRVNWTADASARYSRWRDTALLINRAKKTPM